MPFFASLAVGLFAGLLVGALVKTARTGIVFPIGLGIVGAAVGGLVYPFIDQTAAANVLPYGVVLAFAAVILWFRSSAKPQLAVAPSAARAPYPSRRR